MIEALEIFLIALVANLLVFLIREKIMPMKETMEYQKKMKELNEKLKNASPEEQMKLLDENLEDMMKYLRKQYIAMFAGLIIIIPVFWLLKNQYSGVIIPLPFKNPFTGLYGLGPIGSYIIFAIITNLIISWIYRKFFLKNPTA